VAWVGEVGEVAGRASGARGVEAPTPLEVALPLAEKTLANLSVSQCLASCLHERKRVVSQPCHESSVRTFCKVCKKKQHKQR